MDRKRLTIGTLLVCFSFLWGIATQCVAQEKTLKPCYEEDALAKVRQWEKTWVGKKIDTTNIDQVKDLLPESLYNVLKDTVRWGTHWFEIVPYRSYPIPPGRVKYTKEGRCKVGPKDELINWVAGVPFPEPQSGIEVAWNFDCWSRGDASFKNIAGFTIDGSLGYDRKASEDGWTMHYAGRCDVPPTPEIDNPKAIYRATYYDIHAPSEVKGQLTLIIRYKDRKKGHDIWCWIPSLRKIRRLSTAQRTETLGAMDATWDDDYGWDGNINRQTYKLLGRKEFLLSRHQDINALTRKEGNCIYGGIQRERIDVYVVEAVCQDPGYIYSKSIWYVDPELWHITYSERYDKSGKFWKIIEHYQDVRKGHQGIEDAEFIASSYIDCQRLHSSNTLVPELKLGIEPPLRLFSSSNFEKIGR
jgi:hypothetical protein